MIHGIRGLFLKHRFERLHSEDSARLEESLAVARAFIISAAIIAIYVDPTEPSRFVVLGYSLLFLNLLYSLALIVYLRSLSVVSARLQLYIHAVDVFCAASLSVFSQGPGSVFFAFFILALVGAAYRWYFRETMVTICVILGLLVVEALLMNHVGVLLDGSEAELNRLIVRSAYLIGVGVLVGFLGQKEKLQRAQVTAGSRIIRAIQGAAGLHGAIRAALESLLDVYGARSAALAIHYWREDQVMVWHALANSGGTEVNQLQGDDSSIPVFFFDTPSTAWCANLDRNTSDFAANCLGPDRRRIRPVDLPLPKQLIASDLTKSVCGTSIRLGEEQRCRLFLFDPPDSLPLLDTLQSLEFFAEQIGPAIYTMLLLDVLRSRAGAIERARLARELHDGVIQSLVGAEMQVEAWRRHKQYHGPLNISSIPSVEDLEKMQRLLHSEVVSLRELMQQMRAAEVNPEELLDVLAVRVDRFRRDTGISARFVSDLEEVSLSHDTCQEIVRIVQEALVNVRKHSEARHAVVRFERKNGQWRLTIDDDGRGFPFNGRRSLSDLDQAFEGPEIVKERVHAIGGDLLIDSTPGRGSHLEITFASSK